MNILCESLKFLDLINDYTIESSDENFSIAEDGVLEYDKYINLSIVPKKTVEYINITLK
jgi:hypothetical protein